MIKQRTSICKVKTGMILASPIISESGKMILAAGNELTELLLERLEILGIAEVEVLLSAGQNESSFETERFQKQYQRTMGSIRMAFEQVRYFQEVPLLEMREVITQSVDPLLKMTGAMGYLQNIKTVDQYTFHHSLEVAVIAGMLAKWLGYPGHLIKDILLAGLLHDIGKSLMPREILSKPGALTQEENVLMRKHPLDGYRLLAEKPTVTRGILLAVLQHHEREDGAGYPMGCKTEKIHPFSKILAISDIYSAMTTQTSYRCRTTPFHVAKEIHAGMYGRLDPEMSSVFLTNIQQYLIGNWVLLSDGRKAKVVHSGFSLGARPLVITPSGEAIDLEQRVDLEIVDCLWTEGQIASAV